jgi:hypothetical protein
MHGRPALGDKAMTAVERGGRVPTGRRREAAARKWTPLFSRTTQPPLCWIDSISRINDREVNINGWLVLR